MKRLLGGKMMTTSSQALFDDHVLAGLVHRRRTLDRTAITAYIELSAIADR